MLFHSVVPLQFTVMSQSLTLRQLSIWKRVSQISFKYVLKLTWRSSCARFHSISWTEHAFGTLQLKFHYKMTSHYYHNKDQFLKKFAAVSSWFGVGGGEVEGVEYKNWG